MSKKILAKRLIAIVAIVTMFAAMTITASAANYSSTTMYVGNDTVKVSTTVSGLANGDQVTYYASNSAEADVYINQYEAEGTSLTKYYIADKDDVNGLTIKMAKVDSEFANLEAITDGTNVGAFSLIVNNEVVYSNDAAPAVDEIVATTIPAVSGDKAVSAIKATYNEVDYTFPAFVVGSAVSIVNPIDFSAVEGVKYVELTVVYGYESAVENFGFNYAGRFFGTDATDGDFLAVLYEATIPADATEVGIVLTEVNGEKIEAEYLPAIGVLGSTTPRFAIALADEGISSFKCAPYYKDGSDNTVIGTAKVINR